MTIVKLSKSGKQLQVVDDFGNVYGIAKVAVLNLLNGSVKQNFSIMTRLPFKVSTSRFGVSPLWDPNGTNVLIPPSSSNDVKLNDDVLAFESYKTRTGDKVIPVRDVEDW